MSNDPHTIEEKLARVPEEATLEVSIPGIEGSSEVLPVGLLCKAARERIADVLSLASICHFELSQSRDRLASYQKTIHDLRGSVMVEAQKISSSLTDGLSKRIKDLEAQIEELRGTK
jgi:hypothetical protein